jgi:hypothetical protein
VRRSSPKAAKARWRLSRAGRTVAKGSAAVRRERVALELGRLPGVSAGRYRLRVAVGGAVLDQIVRVHR